ncbi:MAG: DUF3352 domain-containing protein [Candidatus Schekmanbacteria bacterium]|nr:DUF3352 domain-containing protein [Candidatus Schekmanbacteria bacterium]
MAQLDSSHHAGRASRGGAAVLAVIGLLLVVVLGVAAYVLMRGRTVMPAGDASPFMARALGIAPADTKVFFALDLEQFGYGPAEQQALLVAITQSAPFKEAMKKSTEAGGGAVDAQTLSWLGLRYAVSISGDLERIAAAAKSNETTSPEQMRKLLKIGLLLASTDDAAATAALERLFGVNGVAGQFTQETHGKATVHVPAPSSDNVCWTVHANFAVLGSDCDFVRTTVDRLEGQDGPSLGEQAEYQEAARQIRFAQGMVAYVAAGELARAISVASAAEPGVTSLLEALGPLAAGSGRRGEDIVTEGRLAVKATFGGGLLSAIFNAAYGLNMDTAKVLPSDSSTYAAINVKLVWALVSQIMDKIPEAQTAKNQALGQLRQQGIDLERDVMEAISGELAYVVNGLDALSSLPPGGDPSGQQVLGALQRMQMIIALHLADKAKFQQLITRFTPPALAQAMQKTTYEGAEILAMGTNFAYAFVDDMLLVSINSGADGIKQVIDAKLAHLTLDRSPGFEEMWDLVGRSKPILVSFSNVNEWNDVYLKSLSSDPAAAQAMQTLKDKFRYSGVWSSLVLNGEGLYFAALAKK